MSSIPYSKSQGSRINRRINDQNIHFHIRIHFPERVTRENATLAVLEHLLLARRRTSTLTMAATLAPSSATTASCCGIANLTFVSQGTGGKRLWKVAGRNDTGYSDWEATLKATCSTPIPDVRLEHTPQWYDATCGPRALCQRMGGDDKNATSRWTFGVRRGAKRWRGSATSSDYSCTFPQPPTFRFCASSCLVTISPFSDH